MYCWWHILKLRATACLTFASDLFAVVGNLRSENSILNSEPRDTKGQRPPVSGARRSITRRVKVKVVY